MKGVTEDVHVGLQRSSQSHSLIVVELEGSGPEIQVVSAFRTVISSLGNLMNLKMRS
ncbi:hypothetical protein DPMN_006764 [Dreissena polymorpha]|uniref:Uncharacterized protein n=1 Tax=Dreissena polymorpha TaxID=45954 RepID=A0A9D4MW25_DREPO|nr:hypothetical protein DPMN_006764 [Dreissena polymorpha]